MIPVTFTCQAKGYESKVVVDGEDPEEASRLVAEWLEFQQRYLKVIRPGDTVQVRGGKKL